MTQQVMVPAAKHPRAHMVQRTDPKAVLCLHAHMPWRAPLSPLLSHEGWRDGSVAKSTHCSFEGAEFRSILSICMAALNCLMPPSGVQVYMQTKYIHTHAHI